VDKFIVRGVLFVFVDEASHKKGFCRCSTTFVLYEMLWTRQLLSWL